VKAEAQVFAAAAASSAWPFASVFLGFTGAPVGRPGHELAHHFQRFAGRAPEKVAR